MRSGSEVGSPRVGVAAYVHLSETSGVEVLFRRPHCEVLMNDDHDRGGRRANYRVPLQLPVEIEAASESVKGLTSNISLGGLLLLTAHDAALSGRVEYNLYLPDFPTTKLRCEGTVLRSAPLRSGGLAIAISLDTYRCLESDL